MWMCFSGQAQLLFEAASPVVFRQYSLTIALICCIRVFLLSFFDSRPLHICHLTMTVVYSLSLASEIWFYKAMANTIPNIVRLVVQVLTVIALSIAQRWLDSPPPVEERRRGRLFAKHYMEGDLLNPPETEDVRKLRKKQL
ncbi:unnamed protein product [Nippostrongylus brasiliensis]|uniref:Transmembrane protein n=1 Tax=Nippostrongylus brasiliensis TaxID=27835 RepID=A0A0N4YFB5_NIPBR|nr:hypothetical protein Q1695_002930 [Nippostrongylus brasiliensis]VDL79034.1 unnamed protein product [Nippostrongylus brasiliensis]